MVDIQKNILLDALDDVHEKYYQGCAVWRPQPTFSYQEFALHYPDVLLWRPCDAIIMLCESETSNRLLAVSRLVVSGSRSDHKDSLMPREHIHAEIRTAPVTTTASYIAASGRPGAFDPASFDGEAFDVG